MGINYHLAGILMRELAAASLEWGAIAQRVDALNTNPCNYLTCGVGEK